MSHSDALSSGKGPNAIGFISGPDGRVLLIKSDASALYILEHSQHHLQLSSKLFSLMGLPSPELIDAAAMRSWLQSVCLSDRETVWSNGSTYRYEERTFGGELVQGIESTRSLNTVVMGFSGSSLLTSLVTDGFDNYFVEVVDTNGGVVTSFEEKVVLPQNDWEYFAFDFGDVPGSLHFVALHHDGRMRVSLHDGSSVLNVACSTDVSDLEGSFGYERGGLFSGRCFRFLRGSLLFTIDIAQRTCTHRDLRDEISDFVTAVMVPPQRIVATNSRGAVSQFVS
jgi:hypothetical protein